MITPELRAVLTVNAAIAVLATLSTRGLSSSATEMTRMVLGVIGYPESDDEFDECFCE